MVDIRRTCCPRELDEAYRLRFDCLIVERGLACTQVQRESGVLRDDADEHAAQFIAVAESEVIVGTLRVNVLRDAVPPVIGTMLAACGTRLPPAETMAVTSRLALRSGVGRNGTVLGRLARAQYRFMEDRRVEHNLVFVESALVPLFDRMGFSIVPGGPVQHPQAESLAMLLRIRDHDHLRRIRSVLRPTRRAR